MSKEAITKARSDTTLGGASNVGSIASAFKRKRIDSVDKPSSSRTAISMLEVDEQSMNTASSSKTTVPTLSLNDVPFVSDSRQTVIQNTEIRTTSNQETDHLVFKLDKLHDKKARFESHENYLSKCLTNNLIPNGLKVFVEPSIGNHNEAFLTKWYGRLEEFSRTLTSDVEEFCKQELIETKAEIESSSRNFRRR